MPPYQSEHKSAFRRVSNISWIDSLSALSHSKTLPVVVLYNAFAQSCTDSLCGGAAVANKNQIDIAAFRGGSAAPDHRRMPSIDSEKSTSTSVSGVVCPDCGVVFTTESHLRMHFRRHTGKRSFHVFVPRHFTHIDCHLSGERPFKCSYCSKTFTRKGRLQYALLSPSLWSFFSQISADLKVSHERRHTGEKPFKCPSCPKRFADKRLVPRRSLE